MAKALTLWQPWASLIALGVKTAETRSWATDYRGPLAIHAAARRPLDHELGDWRAVRLDRRRPEYSLIRMPESAWHDGRAGIAEAHPVPLGAVVAMTELVDVVPVISSREFARADVARAIVPERDGLWLYAIDTGRCLDMTAQLPFGDFTPGRWVWLLNDVESIEPRPARGRQQLWEWHEAAA